MMNMTTKTSLTTSTTPTPSGRTSTLGLVRIRTVVTNTSLIAAFIATLSACGGGGDANSVNAFSTATLPDPGNLTSDATHSLPSTYPTGSVELKYFKEINLARGKGGFGLLAQDVSLDTGASRHAVYFDTQYDKQYYFTAAGTLAPYTGVEPLNVRYMEPVIYGFASELYSQIDAATSALKAHVEAPGQPGFTGIRSIDRANAAGYANGRATSAQEVIGFENHRDPLDQGCVSELLRTVFHGGILLESSLVDVGIGTQLSIDGKARTCVINTSNSRTMPARAPDGWVGIFPGDGATGVATTLGSEVPNPAPVIAIQGLPTSLYVTKGHALSVTSFTLTTNDRLPVTVKVLTQKDFPTYIGSHQAYIVPYNALRPGTTYTAAFAGKDDSRAFSRTWTFTTGAK